MGEVKLENAHAFGTRNYLLDYVESSGARVIAAVGQVPRHIAFCMDGNRRYAKKEKLNEGAGHVAGFETMLRILVACYRIGVRTVTVYAFSIENFNRSPEESDILFNLVRTKLWNMVKNRDSAMRRMGWHIRFPGSRELLAPDLIERINEIESCTQSCHEMVVNICAPYTTRDDLAHALSLTAAAPPTGSRGAEDYAAKLDQSRYMAPSEPLDILIRTSGETRFSDFMCWEASSQCTFEFVPKLWPELTAWDLYRIIAKWQVRQRGFLMSRRPQPLSALESSPPLVSVSQKAGVKGRSDKRASEKVRSEKQASKVEVQVETATVSDNDDAAPAFDESARSFKPANTSSEGDTSATESEPPNSLNAIATALQGTSLCELARAVGIHGGHAGPANSEATGSVLPFEELSRAETLQCAPAAEGFEHPDDASSLSAGPPEHAPQDKVEHGDPAILRVAPFRAVQDEAPTEGNVTKIFRLQFDPVDPGTATATLEETERPRGAGDADHAGPESPR